MTDQTNVTDEMVERGAKALLANPHGREYARYYGPKEIAWFVLRGALDFPGAFETRRHHEARPASSLAGRSFLGERRKPPRTRDV